MTIKVQRRVILSGTPIQNDLSEYFSLLNFANPNFLGSKNDFRKNFENAIIRGRDADATDLVKAESEKKLKELGGLVAKFIIRRTNDLLSKYCECPLQPVERAPPEVDADIIYCKYRSSMSRLSFAIWPQFRQPCIDTSSPPRKSRNCFEELDHSL